MYIQKFLDYMFLGNSVFRYLVSALILIAGFLAIKLIFRKFIKRVEKLAEKTPGDFIVIDDYMGAIENIGLKTTRLRSLTGEMLIFPNSHLTDSRLRNYKLMQKRRVEFKISVDYLTDFVQVQEIPKIITDIISPIKEAVLERAHLMLLFLSLYHNEDLVYLY